MPPPTEALHADLTRLRKLIALAGDYSTTEHEAAVAGTYAAELMARIDYPFTFRVAKGAKGRVGMPKITGWVWRDAVLHRDVEFRRVHLDLRTNAMKKRQLAFRLARQGILLLPLRAITFNF